MAGMLPGVECARRRRFHQGDSQGLVGNGGTRRSSFCLYTSNNESHLNSSSSMMNNIPFLQRNVSNKSFRNDKLEGAAREAKERLDERFRIQREKESKRHISKGSMKSEEKGVATLRSMIQGLQTEAFGLKKSSSKRLGWAKFGWKAVDQDVCAVCLEGFKGGQNLVHLPCAHRFHSSCLVPWLENNANCPCCRTDITASPTMDN